jgi:UDP-galactopyranose mutase
MANLIAEHNQEIPQKPLKGAYIVVGAGAAGSVVAGELSKTGAEILVIGIRRGNVFSEAMRGSIYRVG